MTAHTAFVPPVPPSQNWTLNGTDPVPVGVGLTHNLGFTPQRAFTAGEVMLDGNGDPFYWTGTAWAMGSVPGPPNSVVPETQGVAHTAQKGFLNTDPVKNWAPRSAADITELRAWTENPIPEFGAPLTITPAGAWPPRSYIMLNDSTTWHWDGTAWAPGYARPAVPTDFSDWFGIATSVAQRQAGAIASPTLADLQAGSGRSIVWMPGDAIALGDPTGGPVTKYWVQADGSFGTTPYAPPGQTPLQPVTAQPGPPDGISAPGARSLEWTWTLSTGGKVVLPKISEMNDQMIPGTQTVMSHGLGITPPRAFTAGEFVTIAGFIQGSIDQAHWDGTMWAAGVTPGQAPVFDQFTPPVPPDTTWHFTGTTPANSMALQALGFDPPRDFTQGEQFYTGDGGAYHWTAAKGWLVGAAPAPAVDPTGVTPGTPGSFTVPAGARVDIPLHLADLVALNLTPAGGTAFPVGTWVALGDSTWAHWDGTQWKAGMNRDPAPMDWTPIFGKTVGGTTPTNADLAWRTHDVAVVPRRFTDTGNTPVVGDEILIEEWPAGGGANVDRHLYYHADGTWKDTQPTALPALGLYHGGVALTKLVIGGKDVIEIHRGGTKLWP